MIRRGVPLLTAALLVAAAGSSTAAELACAAAPATISCEKAPVGFAPAYPDPATMPAYAAFTATLPGLGYLHDSNDDGSLADERCDASTLSQIGESVAALKIIQSASALCEVSPENLDIPCWVAATIVATAAEAAGIVADQCKYQDGQVADAEIEAAYENVRLAVATQIEVSLDSCTPLGTMVLPRSLGGRAEEVRELTRRRIDQMAALGQIPNGVARAEEELALGDAELASAAYRDAFSQFCKAYKQLQLARR